MKVRLQHLIFVACCNNLTRERISRFVAVFFPSHLVREALILSILSSGSLISMLTVSSMIPRKVREVDGPSIFFGASRTPKLVHNCMKVLRFCWHSGERGGPISKNIL